MLICWLKILGGKFDEQFCKRLRYFSEEELVGVKRNCIKLVI